MSATLLSESIKPCQNCLGIPDYFANHRLCDTEVTVDYGVGAENLIMIVTSGSNVGVILYL